MTVKNLADTDFSTIIDCFHQAFENYFVPFPKENEFWKTRWQLAKVDFSLSYGMFENNLLIGFIINAVDYRNKKRIAFNTGTGVLPAYRGKRIVKSIYKYAIKDLVQHGITACALEVITENTIAIKAYKSIGFNIVKKYKCFSGKIQLKSNTKVTLHEINFSEFDALHIPNQEHYSWDHHKNVLKNGNYTYFKIINNHIFESFFVINPTNGYIAQFDTLTNKEEAWKRLFTGINQIAKTVKINNIDERLTNKIKNVALINLKNTIDQFEMRLDLE